MIYGYCRVSTTRQHEENQHFAIEQFCFSNNLHIDAWVEEKISLRKALDKRKLGELLSDLQENDILIFIHFNLQTNLCR